MRARLRTGVSWNVFQPQENIMAVEIFLKLDGIAGGTRNFAHKGYSDVTSWAWELQSNRSSSQLSEGDKIACRQITITKRIGMDSPDILSHYAQAKPIAFAELTVVPVVAKREAKQKYLSINMEDVLVKSVVTGGNSSEEFFNETIVLLFGRVKYEFSVNAVPGSDAAGGDYKFAWDINQSREWQ
jgi:type VI secretion system secreted protein Hcp